MPDPPVKPAQGTLAPPAAGGSRPGHQFQRLVEIMATLRSPDGCPWDREQTLRTLAPYVQEEAAEVVDAIDRGDPGALCEEVGDLIFEGVFLAQVAAEAGEFTVADALRTVCEKLVRRHPHVFAQPAPAGTSERAVETPAEVLDQWDRIKAGEKQAKTGRAPRVLDAVPRSLPALSASCDIGRHVAKIGFDWPAPGEVLDKIEEEIAELRAELARAGDEGRGQGSSSCGRSPAGGPTGAMARVADELGDLLFSLAQLARKLDIDPEAALRDANRKFRRRFDALEDGVRADGHEIGALGLEALEARWRAVKAAEARQD